MALLLIITGGSLWPELAHAGTSIECPTQVKTVAAGGQFSIDLSNLCSAFGSLGIVAGPAHGSLINVDLAFGQFTYVNDGLGALSDTFTVYDDSWGTIDIHVTVLPGSPPTTGPTSATVSYGSTANPITLNITGGTASSVAVSTQASHGTATATVAAITYTPTPGYAGPDTFSYTATNDAGTSAPATVTVTVSPSPPQAPTVGTATTTGSGQAQVTFAAPGGNGGATITGYTATSSPGNLTGSGASSPITVTGLTNGIVYTFTVTATNTVGTGPASQASNSVTPLGGQTISFNNPGSQNFGTTPTLTATASSLLVVAFSSATTGVCTTTTGGTLTFISAGTCIIDANQAGNGTFSPAPQVQQAFTVAAVAPSAPVIGTTTAGNTQASVAFAPPANTGGAPINSYTVTSSPGGVTATGSNSPITVTGLTNGTAYTFTVTANNGTATGNASAASNSVTPIAPQTITFGNPGSQNFGTSPQLNATTTSSLLVAFTSVTTSVCTVTATGLLNTVAPGTCTIHTDQAGNTAFLPAPQVSQSFAIVVPGGAVSLSTPSPLPVGAGGVPYSLTFVSAGGAAPYTYTESGTLPVGMSMTPAGTLSGTPTSAGMYSFTVTVTDSATQTAQKTYQLTINAPGIALAPSTLPQGQVAAAYTPTTLSASGGSAPYSYAVTSGAMPNGLMVSPAGVVSGIPTTAGSFNVTVTATDKFNFQGAQAYTIVIGQPVPVVVNDSASANANGPVTIPVTANDTGPITSVAIAQQPAHGAATVSGLNITYTPANNYFGSDTLKYTATGPGGTSTPATVTITVIAGAVPVATPLAATVLAGKSVTIHAAAGASNGPFTAAAITGAPASGTAIVQGTDIVYTADPNASGTISFDYTLSNAFGASQPAHVTMTVNARPVAQALTASAIAGTTVKIDLTAGAHGGPFTAATLLTISPANAGSATIQATATGYTLSFTAAPSFGGTAQLSYTLSNAFATSDPGSIAISVTLRSDPSKNAEVMGVLDAQADAARRMATGQISNFQRRLEDLHSGGFSGFSNGLTFNSASSQRRPDSLFANDGASDNRRYLVSPDPSPAGVPAASSGSGATPGDIAFWTGGAVNFGKSQPGGSDNGIDFTTAGVSFGADKQISSQFTAGVGVGYGHDSSDVGQHDSRSSLDSYNAAFYASYHPNEAFYTDALLGYQWLSFDARRYVTDNGNTVYGSRDGKQLFGSLSVGYERRMDSVLLNPYGRLDVARASLNGYTESGDPVYALTYQRQTVNTSTATLGMLAQWAATRDYGVWAPQLRMEFGHDMQGSSQVMMRYADLLNGPLYQATLLNQSRNHTLLGAGVSLQTLKGWTLRAEYQSYLDNTSGTNQSILLGVEKKFEL